MRLFILLMLFSLPAFATINAADFNIESLACTDGTRNTQYAAGNCPSPTADYKQDWSTLTTSSSVCDIDAESDLKIQLHPNNANGHACGDHTWRYSLTSALTEREAAESHVMRIETRGDVLDGAGKARVELQYGVGTTDFDDLAMDTDFCVGYSMYLSDTANEWPTSNGGSPILAQIPVQAGGGGGMIFLQTSDASSSKVKFSVVWKEGATLAGETKHVAFFPDGASSGTRQMNLGQWYDLYWSFKLDHDGSAGRLKFYVRDHVTTTEYLLVDYTGRIGWGDQNPASFTRPLRLGVYWANPGTSDKYVAYFSTIRAHQGTNCIETVKPQD